MVVTIIFLTVIIFSDLINTCDNYIIMAQYKYYAHGFPLILSL